MAATDIVELIGKTVLLKKRGKNYLGLCPFHSEKSPSFNVDPVKQFFHCFGCKKSGDAITFVMERDRVAFIDALRSLGDAAGIAMPASGVSKEKAGQRKQLIDANSSAALFFEKLLLHPVVGSTAREYLARRGFNDETIRQFRIGLAPDAWDGLLKSPATRGFSPHVMATAGLAKPRERDGTVTGYYDTFRNRIMFPIRNESGQVIAFGGREMPGSDSPPKYLNSPETPLFSKSRSLFGLDLARQKIIESRTVAIVEGYTDVVMAHQYGATNVVSALGTAITEGHVTLLRRFADRIVLLLDPDSAGDTAVNRTVELFLTQPVEIAIASLPEGLDPDEFLVAHGLAAFEAVLSNAQDALSYKWKQLVKQFNANGDDLTGQQKAVQQYMDVLAGARGSGPVDSLRWGQALTRVSRLTEISVEDLNKRFRQTKPQASKSMSRTIAKENQQDVGNLPTVELPLPPKRKGTATAAEQSERWILAVLLAEPHRWNSVLNSVTVNDFREGANRRLAELYWNHQRDEGEPVFNEFLSGIKNPVLAELAVDLIADFDAMADPQSRLKDAIAFLEELKRRDREAKQLATLKRTSVVGKGVESGTTAGDADDMLRKIQETARRTDLRRTGS